MCEFYLKGQCFHPKKVARGEIANSCEAHTCNECTSSTWQTAKVKEHISYYQELIQMSSGELQTFEPKETQAQTISKIFG